MCVYIYIYTFIDNTYIYIYKYTHTRIYIYIYIYIRITGLSIYLSSRLGYFGKLACKSGEACFNDRRPGGTFY